MTTTLTLAYAAAVLITLALLIRDARRMRAKNRNLVRLLQDATAPAYLAQHRPEDFADMDPAGTIGADWSAVPQQLTGIVR